MNNTGILVGKIYCQGKQVFDLYKDTTSQKIYIFIDGNFIMVNDFVHALQFVEDSKYSVIDYITNAEGLSIYESRGTDKFIPV